jgi:hypothetical protein
MDEDKARRYRRDIEALINAENVKLPTYPSENGKLPTCPYDGKLCNVPDMSCSVELFGSFASDGKVETLWSCPRSHAKKKLRSF